jgi:hypothetical protein
MTASVLLYDPTAPRQQAARQPDNTLAGLAGTVVGFIDNAKPNFNHLVDDLSELLLSRYGVSEVVKRRKRAASVPAADDVYQELAERCDLVITGSGD